MGIQNKSQNNLSRSEHANYSRTESIALFLEEKNFNLKRSFDISSGSNMPTVEETINTLKDMGFPEERAKKALNKTGWAGVEAAMEWLLSHPEDEEDDDEEVVEEEKPAEPKPELTEEEKAKKLEDL